MRTFLLPGMAYDLKLAERIRKHIGTRNGVVEKAMFGGLAFLVHGNMSVGVHGGELIARLEPSATDAALKEKHTRVFALTGRPMKGWILVQPEGLKTDAALGKWVGQSVAFAASLPKKKH